MLIGRDVERARVRELVDGARDGRSGVLLLAGEAGIGKTSLLREAEAQAAGVTVLRARGVESESDLPFAGLSELLAPVLDRRDGLPEIQRGAIEGALALGPTTPGADQRFAMAAGTLGLLALAAEDQPVLAIVDDLQWLDEASAEAVLFAARRLGSEGVAILLAARDAPGAPFEAAGVDRVGLAPLGEAAAREVLAATPNGAALATSVADRLLATADGNPLALTEIPALLDDEQRAGRAPLEEPLPAGTGIARAFARRLEGLPEDARMALLLAAADESARLDVLLAALREHGHDASALERAEAAGVVELERGNVRFRHPLWRSAAYHAATPPSRRAAHETLAGAWPEDSPSRAWHLAAASLAPDETVAAALEAAAHSARERGAHPAAAQAFARAAHSSPDDARAPAGCSRPRATSCSPASRSARWPTSTRLSRPASTPP